MKILARWTKFNQILFGKWLEVEEDRGFRERVRGSRGRGSESRGRGPEGGSRRRNPLANTRPAEDGRDS